MHLKRLSVLNYKNIPEADLSFSPGINCFIGPNGEGKTNLLDAVYFLSFTKSATNATDSLNVRHGEDMMMLQGIYDINGTEEHILCGMKKGQRKTFRRNDKPYKRMVEHIGLLPLIWVSPGDSSLILGGSEERRKFIDSVIAQYDTTYLYLLTRYNKALQQRNALLKAESEGLTDVSETVMESYETMMAQCGEQIFAKRQDFVTRFVPVFQQFYDRISGNNERVSLRYTSHCQRGPLQEIIHASRMRDLAVGYSLHGVHKDDLEMCLDDYPIKNEGSQGQNKTYLVSLKLAQFDFLCHASLFGRESTTPILLLDDIFDKLDATRVTKIVELVASDEFGQIFFTDTNRQHLDRIIQNTASDYSIFTIQSGKVTLAATKTL